MGVASGQPQPGSVVLWTRLRIDEADAAHQASGASVVCELFADEALRQRVWPLIAAGKIRPVIHSTFPAAHAAQAHALMESNEHVGKIVLTW